jgi:acyl-CoA synthetase (NDP forming)
MLEPSSIAIVGVSAEGMGFGKGILLALQHIGYGGELFPVNPKGGTVAGLPIYENVGSIPHDIDLGILAVPAKHVPAAVEECRRKGAAGVEILSSGFKETGTEDGIELEKQLRHLSKHGIRIIGPNCFGIYNPRSGLTLLPGPDLSREPGPVAFISQSGGLTVDFAHVGKWRGIRFSTMVSFGNGVDLRETELLDYFLNDPETGVIAMYIEGLEDGRQFFKTLKAVTAKKPVIICKGGMSESGMRAAMSHTASIAGKSEVWKSVIRQCNAVLATDLNDICNCALAFSTLPRLPYRGLSLIGGGGAIGVAAADMAADHGMNLPELAPELQSEILPLLPQPGSSAKNPVDVANPFVAPQNLEKVLIATGKSNDVDIQIVVQLLYHYKSISLNFKDKTVMDITPLNDFAEAFASAVAATGKPLVVVLPEYKQEIEALDIAEMIRTARKLYTDKGIPVFTEINDAIRSISTVSLYQQRILSRQ